MQTTKIQKDARTPMVTAALVTIAKTWKQPKCPSADEWIEKMSYIYTIEHYSAIKRNEIGHSQQHRWTEGLSSSVTSERERQTPCEITYMWNLNCDASEIYKTATDTDVENRLVAAKGAGVGEGRSASSG